MTTLMRRPGTTVFAVPGGLYLGGWPAVARMDCPAVLVALWERAAPLFDAGIDVAAWCASLPEPTAAAVNRLVALLTAQGILLDAATDTESVDELTAFLRVAAPDPAAAARALSRTRIEVDTDRRTALTAAIEAAVPAALSPDQTFTIAIDHGNRRDTLAAGSAALPVTVRGQRVLIGPAGSTAAHRLASAGEPEPADRAGDVAAIAATVVDQAVRAITGVAEPRALLCLGMGSGVRIRRVVLPAAPGDSAWEPVALAIDPPPGDTALLAATETLRDTEVGLVPDPHPGDLPQLPLALAATRIAGHTVHGDTVYGDTVFGHGEGQLDARADAVREACRRFVPTDPTRANQRRVCGHGRTELLADALLRLSTSTRSGNDADPRTARWSRCLDLLGVRSVGARVACGELAGERLGRLHRACVRATLGARSISRIAVGDGPQDALDSATFGLLGAAQLHAAGVVVPATAHVRCRDALAIVHAALGSVDPVDRLTTLVPSLTLRRWTGQPEFDRAGLWCGVAEATP
jgi:hypothetical protein